MATGNQRQGALPPPSVNQGNYHLNSLLKTKWNYYKRNYIN